MAYLISDVLKQILEKYLPAKALAFRNSEIARLLSNKAPESFERSGLINQEYQISGSAGKGRWAVIPWIAIFDKSISTSAQIGYDIVYLFDANMQGVYLTLNQGWTYFKNRYGVKTGKSKINQLSQIWRDTLKSSLSEFPLSSIDLKAIGSNTDLPEGYELGTICAKYYKLTDFPDEQELRNDLQNIIAIFRELKGWLVKSKNGNPDIEASNNKLLTDPPSNRKDADESPLSTLIEDKASCSNLTLTQAPTTCFKGGNQKSMRIKTDFYKRELIQIKLGLAGELMALKYEKDWLIKNNIAYEIEHTSQVIGDGIGYDIKSVTDNLLEKYIEVKTTRGNINTPFHISAAEVSFSVAHPEQYYLYRIYEFNPKNQKGKLYILHGDISKLIELNPESYVSGNIV